MFTLGVVQFTNIMVDEKKLMGILVTVIMSKHCTEQLWKLAIANSSESANVDCMCFMWKVYVEGICGR